MVVTIAFAVYGFLISKQNNNEEFIVMIKNGAAKKVAYVLSAAVLYLTCIFGVNLYFGAMDSYHVPNVYHRLISYVLGITFFTIHQRTRQPAGWIPITITGICILIHFISNGYIQSLRNSVLEGKQEWTHLLMHWISNVPLLYLIFQTIQYIKNNQQAFERNKKVLSWSIPAILVLLLSREFRHLFVVGGYDRYSIGYLQQQYGKAVLTILWAVCSFALMWVGMKYKNKTLRIVSLSLFSLALLKLFFADLRGISEGGKIAAFILLGVLLLTVSFMYQKLKKMIIDDAQV